MKTRGTCGQLQPAPYSTGPHAPSEAPDLATSRLMAHEPRAELCHCSFGRQAHRSCPGGPGRCPQGLPQPQRRRTSLQALGGGAGDAVPLGVLLHLGDRSHCTGPAVPAKVTRSGLLLRSPSPAGLALPPLPRGSSQHPVGFGSLARGCSSHAARPEHWLRTRAGRGTQQQLLLVPRFPSVLQRPTSRADSAVITA